MAAISLTAVPGRFSRLLAAQTGATTSWVQTPGYPCIVIVHLDITTAGTNTILTLKAGNVVPTGAYDDTRTALIATGATITAASYHTYAVGPALTAVADVAGAGAAAVVPAVVPAVLGITVTPTGSTYSTAIEFRRTF